MSPLYIIESQIQNSLYKIMFSNNSDDFTSKKKKKTVI